MEHRYQWSRETTWNLFKVEPDGSNLIQLTDSQWDDFDACWLPNGRVVFVSERRGGYIRCFSGLPVPQHVLHSMDTGFLRNINDLQQNWLDSLLHRNIVLMSMQLRIFSHNL